MFHICKTETNFVVDPVFILGGRINLFFLSSTSKQEYFSFL